MVYYVLEPMYYFIGPREGVLDFLDPCEKG
jgi:hypothetical protein